MRARVHMFAAFLAVVPILATAQPAVERIDTAAVLKIRDEGLNHSQVMQLLSRLCDVEGPRLTWSPEYRHAAAWANSQLRAWGLANVHDENWAPVGTGWSLKEFTIRVTAPVPFTVIGCPKAWSPDMGDKEAEVVYLDVKTLDDFKKFEGKLKGKYVLLNPPVDLKAPFEPFAERLADSLLLRMANADLQGGRRGGRRNMIPRFAMSNFDSVFAFAKQFMPNIDSAGVVQLITDRTVTPRKLQFAQEQGAVAALSAAMQLRACPPTWANCPPA